MDKKLNLYTRTEEQKTNDILVYETKAKARDICDKFESIKKKADVATVIGCALFFCGGVPLFYKAYDSENLVAMIAVILGFVILTLAVRLCCGAVLSRSLFVFAKWSSLSSRWKYAREEMHKYEEMFQDQRVFEDDMKQVETRLLTLSKELIAFAKKHNISTDG